MPNEREPDYNAAINTVEPEDGQVLAPGVTIKLHILENLTIKRRVGTVFYVMGELTYHDIFENSPLHTTKFCLMDETEPQLSSCPGRMD